MANRLATAISPYLRSHADNPVDWYPWGPEAFTEATRRDVPVLVSIGYSTCHWCHVMARESFSDPILADHLNASFVAIKVDREEHPEVDAAYLAAAGAFTQNLGWPLNVFVTPTGRTFFAGTYSPPIAIEGHASFGQVLDAVTEAWTDRRDQVDDVARRVSEAVAAGLQDAAAGAPDTGLPSEAALDGVVTDLAGYEDTEFGGFGTAPKFPVAPVLGFLVDRRSDLGIRTLRRMAASPLRDPVEGGFFRYAVRRDWHEPHYERMLYDNAQLLDSYAAIAASEGDADWAREAAAGIADFLLGVLRQPGGGFGSAQDSESTVAGVRVEGGYYALDASERARETPPAVDAKVLSGWNGLAIASLARAGFLLGEGEWTAGAVTAADFLMAHHVRPDGLLVRTSIGGVVSNAPATLEDYGMLATGSLVLAAVTGELRFAEFGRRLVDAVLEAGGRAPGGGDPVLTSQGLSVPLDPSEGAYPSGTSASAEACRLLFELTAERRYLEAARRFLSPFGAAALARPIAFGATLAVLGQLAGESEQLVIVTPDVLDPHSDLVRAARIRPASIIAIATESQARSLAAAGFALFEGRTLRGDRPTAYLCRDFVCRLPVTSASELA